MNLQVLWQKLAAGLFGLLLIVVLAWCGLIWRGLDSAAQTLDAHTDLIAHDGGATARAVKAAQAEVDLNSENTRMIHATLKRITATLRRIDKNTGGPGELDDPPPLLRPGRHDEEG